jgi:cell division protein FtsW (lipid II flippase)
MRRRNAGGSFSKQLIYEIADIDQKRVVALPYLAQFLKTSSLTQYKCRHWFFLTILVMILSTVFHMAMINEESPQWRVHTLHPLQRQRFRRFLRNSLTQ